MNEILDRFRHVFEFYKITAEEREAALKIQEKSNHLERLQEPAKGTAGYVYIMQCNEFFKIGIAIDPKARLALLQTGNPYKIALVSVWPSGNPRREEQALHIKYASSRVRGEWFALPADVVALLRMRV